MAHDGERRRLEDINEMRSLSEWLETLGLARYTSVFEENGVDMESLRLLNETDLEKLGVLLGHRKKLLNAIATLGPEQVTEPQSAESATERAPLTIPSSAGERRQLTVMFCDLVGSTALAERIDPEELRDLMQAYRKACSDIVARYDGHVAQYLGDGLMVYFGWPSAHEDDAERGVRSALEMVQAVKGVSAKQPLAVRIGVATGAVVVGEASGADNAEAKLAVGETPNLAARLQGLAGPDEIVIAPATRRLVGDAFELTDLGARPLKGIAQPVRAWRVEAVHRTEGRFAAAHGGVALTPLVGREEEVALLLRRWQQARDGEGQVVLVSGEPGIGKSRLTQVLREQIAGEPCTTLRYQCSPYHLNSALYPIIEQLEFAAGFTREDTPEQKLDKMEAVLMGSADQIAESAPLVAALLSLPTERYPPLKLSPQKQKEKTLEALAGQVEALARRQPVLMVFEDAHWIDPTSQESLDVLVPRLQALPILLVITYRTEYTPHWAEQAHVTTLGLSRLGRRLGAELVAKVTGGKALPAEVLEQIVAHTDGVPLFVEELTKSVLESGLLHESGDQYTLQAPLPALAIPTSLRDSLLARLDRLAPIREIAQMGACIGREFSYELLAAVSPLKGVQLEEGLEQLTQAGLVFRRGTPPSALYTFKHALVQDAAYDALLRSKRAQLHAEIARSIEAHFPDIVTSQPELVAHHYTAAESIEQAIPYWHKAGELALHRMAVKEAIAHLTRGMELLLQLSASQNRDTHEFNLRTTLGMAWMTQHGWAVRQVGEHLERAWQLAEVLERDDHTLRLLWGLWIHRICVGHVRQSHAWAEQLLAEAERTDSEELRLAGHGAMTVTCCWLGEFARSIRHGELALASHDSARDRHMADLLNQDPKAGAGLHKAHAEWMLGYPDRALRTAQEMVANARTLGRPFGVAWALFLTGYVYALRGEPEPFARSVDEVQRLGSEHGLPFFEHVIAPVDRAWWLLLAGRPNEAEGQFREMLPRRSAIGLLLRVPLLKALHAQSAGLSGEPQLALRLLDEAVEQIERPGWEEKAHLAEVLRLKGWILMRQGKLGEAEAQLRASIDCARQQQARSWELRSSTTMAELLAERGERDAARELLAPIYSWFTEGFDTKDLKVAREFLDSLR